MPETEHANSKMVSFDPVSSFILAPRLRAAIVSLIVTAAVAVATGTVVFGIWYPTPFREISGGQELFFIVVAADLVLGPLVTLVIFDRRKQRSDLIRDLSIVASIQLTALLYGLHTLYLARPAALALEIDRVRVVRAIDLDAVALSKAPPALRQLPLWGRLIVAATVDRKDMFNSTALAMAGLDIGQRPERWVTQEQTAKLWIAGSKPLVDLIGRYPKRTEEIRAESAAIGLNQADIGFLPMLARRSDWIVLIDRRNGKIVGYMPFDGF